MGFNKMDLLGLTFIFCLPAQSAGQGFYVSPAEEKIILCTQYPCEDYIGNLHSLKIEMKPIQYFEPFSRTRENVNSDDLHAECPDHLEWNYPSSSDFRMSIR